MPAVEVLREVAAELGIRVEVATVEVTDQAEDGAAYGSGPRGEDRRVNVVLLYPPI